MATFAEVLAAQLRRDPGRPLLTFYDHATDERVELSVTTYANWVAKAAGLLTDVADLERGMSLRIDLPPHWLSPVFLGAAWSVGLRVTTDDAPDAVVCGPDTLDAWAPARQGDPRAGLQPASAGRPLRRAGPGRRARRGRGDLVAARRLDGRGTRPPRTTSPRTT